MPNNVNNKSQTYLIARALQRCEHCLGLTPVVGLVLPVGHESLAICEDPEQGCHGGDGWEIAEADAALFYVEYLSEAVQRRMQQLSPGFFVDYSDSTQESYWMNHCSFCRAQQRDFELYCEPEGAFMPLSEDAARSIRLHEVREPFEAQVAGYALAPEFLEYAQRETWGS